MFWNKRIYLDTAAGVSGNPSSPHAEGRKSRTLLEEARAEIARLVEVKADDVIFTSGATEANALAILGLAHPGAHFLYLSSAHASAVENMKLAGERGVVVEELPIQNAKVNIEKLKKMIRPETVLVSMDAVCGETGIIWNTREVAQVLKEFRTGAAKNESAPAARPIQLSFFAAPMLHVDASQAPLTEKITRAHFGADLLTLDASKVGAVRGIGALIAHRTIPLEPLYRGGGQEMGLRPGSESPELAKEFAAALRAAATRRVAFRARAELDRARLVGLVLKSIKSVFVNEGAAQVPNILNISLIGRDTDYLVALLDEAGFAVATRSACETDSQEGSRAVFALAGDKERALSTIRISWNSLTTSRELEKFANALIKNAAFSARGGSASGGIDTDGAR